jgi:phospholipid/cholesterol/gamma-HCH transport system substrate-binding protein
LKEARGDAMKDILKVGIFMTLALAVLGYLILRAEQIRLFAPRGAHFVARFESVAGLDDQSAIRVAGVRVGRVDGIELRGGEALVGLLLERDVTLPEGTRAEIANLGLLGDKYVELVLGPEGAPPLREGAVIPGVPTTGIDDVITSIGQVAESLRSVTGQLSGEREVEGPLGRLVVNLESTSAQLRDLIGSNRDQLDATFANFEAVSASLAHELPALTRHLGDLLEEVRLVVAENRGPMRDGLANVEKVTDDLQISVRNLNDISGRLARGEGTLGKLLTSEEAHDELVAALESVQGGVDTLSSTLGRVNKLRLDLALQGFYLQDAEATHGSFSLDVDPQSGRLYRVAVVDDPAGRLRTKTQTITTTRSDGSVETEVIENQTVEDKTSISALFGFPVGERYRLWAGLVESRFGVQLDYEPHERWNVSLEAFDFDRQRELDPHLRLTAAWRPLEHFYLLGGYDDPLVSDRDSLFVGAGIRWRDDDLKYLLGSIPRF